MNAVIFNEEVRNLLEIQKQIDGIIGEYQKDLERYRKDIEDFYVLEASDILDKQYLISQRTYYNNKVDEYTAYKQDPYFGRMDLLCNKRDYLKVLIGKTGIRDKNGNIVFDWRSPIGGFFYLKTENKYQYNNNKYKLLLRRSYSIKHGELIDFETEYEDSEDGLRKEEKIVDPFLIKLLAEKRKEKALTDIIATIQGNQNTMIRKPMTESFVVQGCAGSGKTMILLHRLSYLIFNKQFSNLSSVKIITPNKFFTMHINDLCEELGLSAIEQLTVEEFYISLIEILSKNFKQDIYGKNRNIVITSEVSLNDGLLKEVYSNEYYETFIEKYKAYWQDFINEFAQNNYHKVLRKSGVDLPNRLSNDLSTHDLLESKIESVIYREENNRTKINVIQKRISNQKEELNKKKEKDKKLFESIEYEKQKITNEITTIIENKKKEIEQSNSIVTTCNFNTTALESTISNLKELKGETLKRIAEIEAFLNGEFNGNPSSYVKGFLSEYCKAEFELYLELRSVFKSIPSYNFIRKNKAKSELKESFFRLTISANSYLSDYQNIKINEIDKNIKVSEQSLDEQSKIVLLEEQKLKENLMMIDDCEKVVSYVNSTEKIDWLEELGEELFNKYYATIQNYIELTTSQAFKRIKKEIQSTVQEIQRNTDELAALLNSRLSDEEFQLLSDAKDFVENRISEKSIYSNFFVSEIKSLYNKFNEKYTKDLYRHKIYLQLLFSALYFNAYTGKPTFINIDEAQDLSVSEYKLIKMILGKKCSFNLYGDVKQNIYDYKGIDDWNQIENIITNNCYILNENYRNTNEITNYCNQYFDMNTLSIGVSGENVEEITFDDIVSSLSSYKQQSDKDRVAIIYKGEESKKKIEELFKHNNSSFDSIMFNNISVISVEMSKGIEFDVVVVIPQDMSLNEKYVSFTRALEKLYIVQN